MFTKTKEELLTALVQRVPLADRITIKEIDDKTITINWFETEFLINLDGSVVCQGNLPAGLLMQDLLKL
jgi:hypothetical protein